MKTIQANVKKILEEFVRARNDDRALIYRYMWDHHSKFMYGTFQNALLDMIDGKIPRFDTITRYSRALQAKHPELAGTNIAARKAKQTKVKQDLAELKVSKDGIAEEHYKVMNREEYIDVVSKPPNLFD